MTALVWAVIACSLFMILFKVFALKSIDIKQATIFNYLTALLLSSLFSLDLESGQGMDPVHTAWFFPAILLGLLYYLGIVAVNASTSRAGMVITTMSSRSSMVIPILLCFHLIPGSDRPRYLPVFIILAALLLMVYNGRKQLMSKKNALSLLFPLLVFLTYGAINSGMKVLQHYITAGRSNPDRELALLAATIYSAALILSIVFYFASGRERRKPFHIKNMAGGLLLGVSNFSTTYLLIIAMKSVDTATLFPIYNSGIVMVTTFAGRLLFKERLRWYQIAGMVLALGAICAIYL